MALAPPGFPSHLAAVRPSEIVESLDPFPFAGPQTAATNPSRRGSEEEPGCAVAHRDIGLRKIAHRVVSSLGSGQAPKAQCAQPGPASHGIAFLACTAKSTIQPDYLAIQALGTYLTFAPYGEA